MRNQRQGSLQAESVIATGAIHRLEMLACNRPINGLGIARIKILGHMPHALCVYACGDPLLNI